MAFQGISTGSGPNVGDGDTLIDGALKINSNFSEIYTFLGDGTDLTNDYILTSEVDDSSIEFTSNTLNVKSSGITNDMLAGSIANDKLSNSELSYGGIALSLGGSDPTPAFDLTNATNYQTSNLSGSIADNQLASTFIKTSQVDDSSIEFTSSTLNVKTGGITNDMLAGSIADSKLSSTFLKNVSNDTNPLLGGSLNANSNNITNANNISANGTVTAGSGFYIGISDANGSVTDGPIKRLSFLGDGNTISVDNGVVSITIAGVGGGAGGVPVASSITLSDTNVGGRYSNEVFAATVTMAEEGTPDVSQKGIKGILNGNFKTFTEGVVLSSSVSNSASSISMNINVLNSIESEEFYDDQFGGGSDTNADRMGLVIKSTARGAGQGPGYYMISHYEGLGNPSTGDQQDVYRLHYAPQAITSTSASLLFQRTYSGNNIRSFPTDANSELSSGPIPLKINVEGNVAWYERLIERVRYDGISSPQDTKPYGGAIWSDTTGVFLYSNTASSRNGYHVCSDGEYSFELYFRYNSDISNYQASIYTHKWVPDDNAWRYMGRHDQTIFPGISEHGIVYHKPSKTLIWVTSGTTLKSRSWTINSGVEYTGSGNDWQNVFSNQTDRTLTSGLDEYDGNGYLKQLTYCGNEGSYMLFEKDWYRWNDVTSNWSVITDPAPGFDNYEHHGGISSDDSGNLYMTVSPSVSSDTVQVYKSTDSGSSWNKRFNDYDFNNSYMNPKPPGMGFGELFVSFENWYTVGSAVADNTGYYWLNGNLFTQSHSNANAGNFAINNRVAKKGQQDDIEFLGYVSGKSGSSTLFIKSKSAFSNNDVLLNLDDFTTGSGTRYLILDSAGDVQGIQQGDPGFVDLGPQLSFNISFPGSLSSGLDTDDDIPAGTTIKLELQCNNSAGNSNIVSSNTINPS